MWCAASLGLLLAVFAEKPALRALPGMLCCVAGNAFWQHWLQLSLPAVRAASETC